uniref:Osiris 7 n=1 Tax=Cacopsylla melanoneura TaxID=428564 RepID=A0A8D8VVU1_9HEMI
MAVKFAAIVCLVYLAQYGSCAPAADPALDIPVQGLHNPNSISSTKEEMMENIYSDCVNKGSYSCLKLKLFTFVDKMLTKDNINLFEGVTVVKTLPITNNGDGAPRAMPVTGDVDTMIASKIENFLSTHTLKIDLKGVDVMNALSRAGRAIDDDEDDEERGKHGGGGHGGGGLKKKKKGKDMMPILLLLKMKFAALLPFILGGIALIAGKALLIGKIALVLSLIIALKKILSQKKAVTYEIVSHPHHTSSHEVHHDHHDSYGGAVAGGDSYGGGAHGGGWGRSSSDPQEMAYSSYKPTNAQ